MGEIKGYISQVIGPVVDIHFDYGTEETVTLPRIHDAMEISRPNGNILIVEVQQHIGENTVRTVAMDTTDGLRRGMEGRVIRNAHHHADRRPSQRTFNECHRRPYRWHGPAY